jgi:hypothetical protein
MSRIVAGGGWKGSRIDRIKVKAWIALIVAILLGSISLLDLESVLFFGWIPALASLVASVILFILEQPVKIESLSGSVGADPRKFYGTQGEGYGTTNRGSAQSGVSDSGKGRN